MRNVYGHLITVTLYGESHGPSVGAVLDGLPAGIPVSVERIAHKLTQRRPQDGISTARREPDEFSVESGVFNGCTTGAPLSVRIPNRDVRSGDYDALAGAVRPGHADYPAACRFRGFEDARGGGHFSGRLTAALVAAGAVVSGALEAKGIRTATHLSRCADVSDRAFDFEHLATDMDALDASMFPVLDKTAGGAMRAAILAAKADGDSVGGVLETVVTGLPAGLGEPWFGSIEGTLANGLFSIPGIKGVEFGDGFGLAAMRGSQSNDACRMRDGRVVTETNRMGGIGGGLTNGMPLVFRCAVKPTPSIARGQDSVDLRTGENIRISVPGRHDPCIAPRARAVVDAVTALTLADLYAMRYGTDALAGGNRS